MHVYNNHCVDFRGPFCNSSDWLSSPMKAEMVALSSTPSPSPPRLGELRPLDSSLTLNIMNLAVRLRSKHPGNHPIISNTTTVSREPFSFMFDDFSLSNIMVKCLRSVHGYLYLICCSLHPGKVTGLLRLFHYGNLPRLPNGRKSQTTTTGSRNFGVGLNVSDRCCGPFPCGKQVTIRSVRIC